MDNGFNRLRFLSELEAEDSDNSPENSGGDSPRSAADAKIASTSSSSKRSRRAIQKRVVQVPIRDVDGLRVNKSDQMTTPPPSDSWAWRKYGQKPIKGSPYPRGYYRCSSSKGCPARKQVERSRVDPKMLVVTYYCEHNHNSPAPAKISHHRAAARNFRTPISEEEEEDDDNNDDDEEEEEEEEKPRIILSDQSHDEVAAPEDKFSNNICEAPPLIHNSEFGWFADFDTTSFTMFESPMLIDDGISAGSETAAMIFTEEDESFFADLGELPECSAVFRRGMVPREAERRRPGLATTT